MGRPQKIEFPLQEEPLEEVCRGMMFASLAITDNKMGTLANVGKANPWHIQALKIVTGSSESAHKPLSEILDGVMKLQLDKIIDISGVTRGKFSAHL